MRHRFEDDGLDEDLVDDLDEGLEDEADEGHDDDLDWDVDDGDPEDDWDDDSEGGYGDDEYGEYDEDDEEDDDDSEDGYGDFGDDGYDDGSDLDYGDDGDDHDEAEDPFDLDVDALGIDDDLESDLTEIVEVSCPYCGEKGAVAIDPVGGDIQEYVEDCEVCCQPWSVRVTLDMEGTALVEVDTLGQG